MTLDDEILKLYRMARAQFLDGNVRRATELYAEIRQYHACELYYEVELPSILRFIHPLGSVLGRATYADHLVVYQQVSVGSDVDGGRPTFTGPCVLFPGSKIIGNVKVGANVWVTAGTIIEARPGHPIAIPDNRVVFPGLNLPLPSDDNQLPKISFDWRPTKRSVVERFFPEPS